MQKVLVPSKDIDKMVKGIAAKISEQYAGREVVFVCVLKGAFMFFSDIIKNLEGVDVVVDFLKASSYGLGTTSTGNVVIKKDIDENVEGKDVILIDDLVDTGNTLKFLCAHMLYKKAKSVKTCVLLDKPSRRQVEFVPDYCAKAIDDLFVIGYGLDAGGKFRGLHDIYYIEE